MEKSHKKANKLSLAIGTGIAVSLASLSIANAQTSPFSVTMLDSGYNLASNHTADKAEKAKGGKCGAGKCGADKKAKDGKCGAGKCGADKKAKDVNGADKKAKGGKCGAGKCGGSQ